MTYALRDRASSKELLYQVAFSRVVFLTIPCRVGTAARPCPPRLRLNARWY